MDELKDRIRALQALLAVKRTTVTTAGLASLLLAACGDSGPDPDKQPAAVMLAAIERLRGADFIEGEYLSVSVPSGDRRVVGHMIYRLGAEPATRISLRTTTRAIAADTVIEHHDVVMLDGSAYIKSPATEDRRRPWQRVTKEQLQSLRQNERQYFDPLLFLDIRPDREANLCSKGKEDVVGTRPTVRYRCDFLYSDQLGPSLERWRRRHQYETFSLELSIDAGGAVRAYTMQAQTRGPSVSFEFILRDDADRSRILAPASRRVGPSSSSAVL